MNSQVIDVSVIIPAHNAERHICDAIDSALVQTGINVEVIVVDNCSVDGTRAVVEARYGSLVRVISESQLGLALARNTGIRLAVGKYIALLDADDVWLPGKLEKQVRELRSRPEIGLVFCHGYEFYDANLSEDECRQYRCRTEPAPFLIASALLASRATFIQVGDYPNVPAGEFVAWYGWAQSLGIQTAVLPDILLRRRIHTHNISRGPHFQNGFLQASKWLMDRRRQAQ